MALLKYVCGIIKDIRLNQFRIQITISNFQINSKDSGAIAWLYEYGNVKKKLFKIDCCNITVSLSVLNANRFSQRFGDLRIF